ncbi:MAG: hypothetical protein V3T22_07775, partial [Planctomycetota bacterium]
MSGAADCGRVSVLILAGAGLVLGLVAAFGLRTPAVQEAVKEIVIKARMEQAPEEFIDHQEIEETLIQDFEITAGDPDLFSDSPFDSTEFNSVIGIGGGAGGKFGARFGGRRVRRSFGVMPRLESAGETYAEIVEHGYRLTARDH